MIKSNITQLIIIMIMILIINLLTIKTSIMCLNLVIYTTMMCSTMSLKMKLSPIPYIIFLTMIGGLMIIFLYFTATMWKKKETLTLKSIVIISPLFPLMFTIKMTHHNPTNQINTINLFNNSFCKMTIIMMILLTMILIFIIEIHMKANSPFRRKLKIWG